MKIKEKHIEKLKPYLPKQRKSEKISTLMFLNAVLYVVENGAK